MNSSDNEGSGQQCCYDYDGQLVVGPPGGGTVDLYAPTSWGSTLNHFTHDMLPFIYCCKGEFSNCDLYYQKRPSDNGKRYILKPPGTSACLISYTVMCQVTYWVVLWGCYMLIAYILLIT